MTSRAFPAARREAWARSGDKGDTSNIGVIARRADWLKVMKVWDRVVAYIEDPKTQPDAVKIMAARSGVSAEQYLPLLKGTKLLSIAEGKKVYVTAELTAVDGKKLSFNVEARDDEKKVGSGTHRQR